MGATGRFPLDNLEREESEVRRRVAAIRHHRRAEAPNVREDGSMNAFEAALAASTEPHDEVVRRRLADKSRALAEVREQVHQGTYGICHACGRPIPHRRLEAIPTATLCVPCQEQREATGR